MSCYTVKRFVGAHAEPPLLSLGPGSSVRSYILTMEDGGRDLTQLQLVTRDTYLLINQGYKKCSKPDVTNAMHDLLHANKYVCALERNNPDPVFVFEDDAQLLSLAPEDFRECIEVARQPGVDAVALCCVPLLSWRSKALSDGRFALDWHRVDVGGTTCAMLLSPSGRTKLLAMQVPPWLPHDSLLYRKLKVYTPRKPLAGQLHPETENQQVWDKSGVIKSMIFDTAQCDQSAYRCYSSFHNELDWNGLFVRPISAFIGLLSIVAMAPLTGIARSR